MEFCWIPVVDAFPQTYWVENLRFVNDPLHQVVDLLFFGFSKALYGIQEPTELNTRIPGPTSVRHAFQSQGVASYGGDISNGLLQLDQRCTGSGLLNKQKIRKVEDVRQFVVESDWSIDEEILGSRFGTFDV